MLRTTSPGRIKDTPVPDGELEVSCFRMGLLVLTGLGFFLRLIYLARISLFVDEFITILAVEGILKQGTPLLPSGLFYEHGLLFSYGDALFSYLFGLSETMVRWPSLFISVLTIPLIYLVGKRIISSCAGFISAALLTFAWDAIMWGGRARMYSFLGFLVLLALFFLYRGAIEADDRKYRWLFILSFLGSIFTQAAAILLFPAFLFGILARRGWRWFIKRSSILEILTGFLGVWAVFVLKRLAQPGQLETLARVRPYVAPSLNFAQGVRSFSPFFLLAERFPMTIFFIVGLSFPSLYLLSRLSPLGERIRLPKGFLSLKKGQKGLTFLYSVFGITMLEMIFLVGRTWKNERYLFMVLSVFFLAVAGSLVEWGRLIRGLRSEWASWLPEGAFLACGIAILASFLSLPRAMEVISEQVWGYDLAFRYLKGHWQPSDRIMTVVPSASVVYLGRTDFYAIQRDYEEYVVKREGVWIDRWTGSPLLNTVDQLREVFEEDDRVWFVVDSWRLATRYQMDFREVIAGATEVAYEVQGVKVLLSQGYVRRGEPAVKRSLAVKLEQGISLQGYELSSTSLEPGEDLRLTLYWQTERRLREEYMIFVHLLNREHLPAGQDDSPPMRGLYPTIYWEEGERVADEHRFQVAANAPPDRYLLEVGIYSPQSGERLAVLDESAKAIDERIVLDYIQIGKEEVGRPQHPAEADFGGRIMLVGYDFNGQERWLSAEPGQAIPLTLYWQALASMDRDYTVFVHLLDEEGRIWGQRDSQPLDGFYPTSFWDVGELVEDEYELTVDSNAPEGNYTLVAGLYFLPTGERLLLPDEERDMLILGGVMVAR